MSHFAYRQFIKSTIWTDIHTIDIDYQSKYDILYVHFKRKPEDKIRLSAGFEEQCYYGCRMHPLGKASFSLSTPIV